MEKIQLKIGTNIGTEKFQIEVPVEIPSTWKEVLDLDIPEDIKRDCFNRAWRIRLQENSGAREHLAGLSADERKPENLVKVSAEVAEIIGQYQSDPTTAKKAGRPRRPQEVALPASLNEKERAKFAAVLEAQGIKVTIK